ncbi:gliding motility-associated-like protein [Lewinella aquimaris]|uniref:Gliding motility-associated-like protein n=1 Tax=Neolewinella aquimaris TaxID=1835722 RepID=A0A840ED95_9BACT|nr:gliding motility-associated C-terminal domain-containing protein [Neolewinella aquimaris]MBB4079948.1 gliding motility-associated-like protein [Neolewinella aquimaris]
MRQLLLIPLLLLLTAVLPAQISAPEFLCTRSEAGGEILTWTNVLSDCGPYEATEIYRSTTADGPYTLLTAINDATATEYRDENPGGQQLFYYLQYRYACPDTTALTSDTLDNFIPATPILEYVSIESGDVLLNWQLSESPEVSGYVVLEITPSGTTPIDTVGGDVTSYRITGVPENELTSRQYRIAAIDPCGNDSPQGTILSGADLTGTGGEDCDADVVVTIDEATLATFLPIASLELFVATDGGPFVGQGTAPGDSPTLTYDLANDGEELCFYVTATLADSVGEARSAVFCKSIDISQPVRSFAVYGVEQEDGGGLRFSVDSIRNAGAVSTTLLIDGIGRADSVLLPGLAAPGGELALTVPTGVLPGDSLRFVQSDSCGRTITTNAVSPVFLQATGLPESATLDWTPLVNGLPGSLSYTVLLVRPDGSLDPVATNLSALTYTDESGSGDSIRCYRIQANFIPAGQDTTYSFLSNESCVAGETDFYLPNVFSPAATQDVNREFRPFFSVAPVLQAYRLLVFDRWGALIFESDDPFRAWNGDYGDRAAPSGAYIYTLSYTTAAGNLMTRSGVVQLLR